jgi:hypothetical protein
MVRLHVCATTYTVSRHDTVITIGNYLVADTTNAQLERAVSIVEIVVLVKRGIFHGTDE